MANHEIKILYTIDETVVPVPDPSAVGLRKGDTVQFNSPHGELTIEWKQNVFDRPVSKAGEILTIVYEGKFLGECKLQRPTGEVIQWAGQGFGGEIEHGEQITRLTNIAVAEPVADVVEGSSSEIERGETSEPPNA